MTPPATFEELARALAMEGASWSCAREAALLASRAAAAGGDDTSGAESAARGLRIAARILEGLAPRATGHPPFRPIGLRGALLAGHAALAQGRPGQAEAIGRGLAAAAPDCPAGLRLVGEALFAQGRFARAEVALREARAVDPDDTVTRALHAEALWFAGRRDEAEAEFARVVALDGEGRALAEVLWYGARSAAAGREVGPEGRP